MLCVVWRFVVSWLLRLFFFCSLIDVCWFVVCCVFIAVCCLLCCLLFAVCSPLSAVCCLMCVCRVLLIV